MKCYLIFKTLCNVEVVTERCSSEKDAPNTGVVKFDS